ncbi:adenosine deaminase [Treponema zioleckii]|uniref:adenosine deaminase n=1 Tax=Treponema zioleckii TaxID=331680 RepID=UPI00168BA95E|nr:adenosine deaminase [Treponema zioleckii]
MIDLHCHLDGAITKDIAKKLASMQDIDVSNYTDEEFDNLISLDGDCSDLNEFLRCFEFPLSLLQTKESISAAVKLVQEHMKKQGILYLELRFAPQLHCQKGLSQEDVVLAALDGLEKDDLHTNLILCLMRGERTKAQISRNMETIELAEKYLVADEGIVAVDLAGDEFPYPTEMFAEEMKKIRGFNIPMTVHAGEAGSAENVRFAVENGIKRIGHGVRIADYPSIVDLVVKNGVTLEVCPTSNRQTRAVKNMDEYPIKKFLEAGVKVTLNTDDPAICRTDLQNELKYVKEKFGINEDDEKRMLLNSVDAAFTTAEFKAELREKIKILRG